MRLHAAMYLLQLLSGTHPCCRLQHATPVFRKEDGMHFEASRDLIDQWAAQIA